MQWLDTEAKSLMDPTTGAMPRGGWVQVSEAFEDRWAVGKAPKFLMLQYYTALQRDSERTFSAAEVQAILRGVNKLLASESLRLLPV